MSTNKTIILAVFMLFLISVWWKVTVSKLDQPVLMPSLHLKDINGELVLSENLHNYNTTFVLVEHVNSFHFALITKLIEKINPKQERLIVVFDSCSVALLGSFNSISKEGIQFVEFDPVEEIKELFGMSDLREDRVLFYDPSRRLESSYHPRKDMIRIAAKYNKPEHGVESYTEDLKEKINSLFATKPEYKSGLYYLSESYCTSCEAIGIFEHFEQVTLNHGIRFQMLLLGDWTDKDINNIKKEHLIKSRVHKAEITLQNLIDSWKIRTNLSNITLIVAKSDTSVESYPILSDKDLNYLYENEIKLLSMLK